MISTLVQLNLRTGSPIWVNPAFVVSVRDAVGVDAPGVELQLSTSPNTWLLRGTLDEVLAALFPKTRIPVEYR